MKAESTLVKVEGIATLIKTIRGQRVILDSDLAKIYGISTKVLNQAVRRNQRRFPNAFMFKPQELAFLRSQSVTLKTGRGQHRKYLPCAFTEHGALMASTVLKSTKA